MRIRDQLHRPTEDNLGVPPQGDYIKNTSNEIKPSYVTFEQSKWLKERGFNVDTETCFHALLGHEIESPMNWDNDRGYLVRPEHWQVIDWLFLRYKLSVESHMDIPQSGEQDGCYVFNGVVKLSDNYICNIVFKSENKPTREKAYSAAFDYIKDNNLI